MAEKKPIEWGESDEIASLSLAAMVVTDNARFVGSSLFRVGKSVNP